MLAAVMPSSPKAILSGVRLEMRTNRVTFPDAQAFLSYWTATSLFQRTPAATAEAGQRLLVSHDGPLVLTKKIAVVTGTA